MKEQLFSLVASKETLSEKWNACREYLQAYILRIMHDEGVFQAQAFMGGTALRFLYDLPRFSEDLDFAQERKGGQPFVDILQKIKKELTLAGYQVEVSYKTEKTVQSAFFKFEGLLYEAKISPLSSQKFSVKVETDTNPPAGANLETRIINKYFPMSFLTHDLFSLFAGKFSAVLGRKYTKGRDFYDIFWYLSKWKKMTPNLELLKNGLLQTGWKEGLPNEENWRDYLYKAVEKADWRIVIQDVSKFLEHPSDVKIFTQENLLSLITSSAA